MSYIPFSQLPAHARLWVFAADRKLSEPESMQLQNEVSAFLEHWTAHNLALLAGCELRYDQFLLIGVDESAAGASGCSIDELYRRIRLLSETFDTNFMNNMKVHFRDASGNIVASNRADFANLASDESIVFDNSITSVESLRAGKWEIPAKSSWHKNLMN